MSFAALPTELQERLLASLPPAGRRCARLACRAWAAAGLAGATCLEATGCRPQGQDALLATVAKVRQLASLALQGDLPPGTLAGLARLSTLRTLGTLRLQLVQVSALHVAALAALPSLCCLELRLVSWEELESGKRSSPGWTYLSAAAVRQLALLTGLVSLRLEAGNLEGPSGGPGGNVLTALSALTRLTCLHIDISQHSDWHGGQWQDYGSPQTRVSSAVVATLGALTALHTLILSDCRALTAEAVAHLAGLTRLTQLRLFVPVLRDEGDISGTLCALTQLVDLQLAGLAAMLWRAPLALLAASLTGLSRLDLLTSRLSNDAASLATLAKLPRLASLGVGGGGLDATRIRETERALAGFTCLTCLNLHDLYFSFDPVMRPNDESRATLLDHDRLAPIPQHVTWWQEQPELRSFPALAVADLGHLVTDAQLAALTRAPFAPGLHTVRLGLTGPPDGWARLTDAGLVSLGALGALTRLRLDGVGERRHPEFRRTLRQEVTPGGLSGLSCLRRLVDLRLDDLRWPCDDTTEGALAKTDRALSSLMRLSSLTRLTLSRWQPVSEAALVELATLPALQLLQVLYTQVVGAGEPSDSIYMNPVCHVVTQAFDADVEDTWV